MGIYQLWANLRQAGVVCELAGKDDEYKIVQTVDGLAVAVDVSIWILQASLQPNLAEVFSSPTARALKVCFDRCLQWLRFGCVPVAVLEGNSPVEKQAEIYKRMVAQGRSQPEIAIANFTGERSHALKCLNRQIAALFASLGLPAVQAPGEAESTCAALQRAGLVAGCATRDSDALVLGAERVFHTLSLAIPTHSVEVQYADLATFRAWLGLEGGGSVALLAVALLVGGDYHRGAERVGLKTAVASLRHLLKARPDDEGLLDRLDAEIQAFRPEKVAALPRQCTGCKRCKHEGGAKGTVQKHTRRNPCACCGPASPEDTDAGFFCAAAEAGAECQCAFHACKDEREFVKMLEKLRQSPGFLEAARRAQRAYEAQMEAAEKAVRKFAEQHHHTAGAQLQWAARPDVAEVEKALTAGGAGLSYDRRTVARKLKLLLREWDAGHPGQGAEFRPARIVKSAGAKGLADAESGWAFVVEWLRGGEPDDDVSDSEWDADGRLLRRNNQGELVEARTQYSQLGAEAPDIEAQRAAEAGRKRQSARGGGRLYMRKSVLEAHWPQLVADFRRRLDEQRGAAEAKEARRQQRLARQAAKDGPGHKQSTLDGFLRQSKPRPEAAGKAPKSPKTPAASRGRGGKPIKTGPLDRLFSRQSGQRAKQAIPSEVIDLDDSPPSAWPPCPAEACKHSTAPACRLEHEPERGGPAAGRGGADLGCATSNTQPAAPSSDAPGELASIAIATPAREAGQLPRQDVAAPKPGLSALAIALEAAARMRERDADRQAHADARVTTAAAVATASALARPDAPDGQNPQAEAGAAGQARAQGIGPAHEGGAGLPEGFWDEPGYGGVSPCFSGMESGGLPSCDATAGCDDASSDFATTEPGTRRTAIEGACPPDVATPEKRPRSGLPLPYSANALLESPVGMAQPAGPSPPKKPRSPAVCGHLVAATDAAGPAPAGQAAVAAGRASAGPKVRQLCFGEPGTAGAPEVVDLCSPTPPPASPGGSNS